jgi:hypothetical protein
MRGPVAQRLPRRNQACYGRRIRFASQSGEAGVIGRKHERLMGIEQAKRAIRMTCGSVRKTA